MGFAGILVVEWYFPIVNSDYCEMFKYYVCELHWCHLLVYRLWRFGSTLCLCWNFLWLCPFSAFIRWSYPATRSNRLWAENNVYSWERHCWFIPSVSCAVDIIMLMCVKDLCWVDFETYWVLISIPWLACSAVSLAGMYSEVVSYFLDLHSGKNSRNFCIQ